jgi:hypothetical protein
LSPRANPCPIPNRLTMLGRWMKNGKIGGSNLLSLDSQDDICLVLMLHRGSRTMDAQLAHSLPEPRVVRRARTWVNKGRIPPLWQGAHFGETGSLFDSQDRGSNAVLRPPFRNRESRLYMMIRGSIGFDGGSSPA